MMIPTKRVPIQGGKEPLGRHAATGNIEAVKQHLADGADLNAKDNSKDGTTPLHISAMHDQKETGEFLIAAGANINSKDEKGFTPLDRANRETADILR